MHKPTYLYTALVPLTLLLWGTEYTLIGFIGEHIAESWQVAIRLVVAAIIMVVIVRLSGDKLPPLNHKAWIWYGIMGVVGMTAPFYLIARGYNSGVDSGLLSILIGVAPLITVFLAHFFIKGEPLTPLKTLGFAIGF
ncbi:MAG TPA: EamA family transporter, partial [Hellea balneolensis]|nr:EamA family transporter [Hellea balneolensis]